MRREQTVYLGQFTEATAQAIVRRLEDSGIGWWAKQSGAIARFVFVGEWGTRLFVDAARENEARRIVADLTDG